MMWLWRLSASACAFQGAGDLEPPFSASFETRDAWCDLVKLGREVGISDLKWVLQGFDVYKS